MQRPSRVAMPLKSRQAVRNGPISRFDGFCLYFVHYARGHVYGASTAFQRVLMFKVVQSGQYLGFQSVKFLLLRQVKR